MSQVLNNPQVQAATAGIRPYLIPAAVGAGIGGPLMAYFAAKNHIEGEDPRMRRHRILRNALLGLTLGGAAGGGIPAGLRTITDPARAMTGFHPIDSAANKVVRNWLPSTVGGVGGVLGLKRLGRNRTEAADTIHQTLGYERAQPTEGGRGFRQPLNEVETRDSLLMRAMDPKSQPDVIGGLAAKLRRGAGSGPWQARELLGEAGIHNFKPIHEMPLFTPEQGSTADSSIEAMRGLKAHLGSLGPISRLMSRLVPHELPAINEAVQNRLSPYRAAELYSKYIRPSVSNSVLKTEGPHWGVPWIVGGVGASMLGANYLQNKLEGN
jgi:hypothetical protein